MTSVFITGIDTDIGKTIATGLMAKYLLGRGASVITQKMVQTGCTGLSEDILIHRRLMGCDLLDVDRAGTTGPFVFQYAASPHLAARLEGQTIDSEIISAATAKLAAAFNPVLIEGAGGLCVPLNSRMTLIDYIAQQQHPVVLVSSSKLGSINHTALSIEALKTRKIPLLGLVYNRYPETDAMIADDSILQMAGLMDKAGYETNIVQLSKIDLNHPEEIDFSPVFRHVFP